MWCAGKRFRVQVSGTYYQLKRVYTPVTSGKYSSLMVTGCKKFGMKPVCTLPECKSDQAALYVPGFSALVNKNSTVLAHVANACTYGKAAATCYQAGSKLTVQSSAADNPVFLCGKGGVGE